MAKSDEQKYINFPVDLLKENDGKNLSYSILAYAFYSNPMSELENLRVSNLEYYLLQKSEFLSASKNIEIQRELYENGKNRQTTNGAKDRVNVGLPLKIFHTYCKQLHNSYLTTKDRETADLEFRAYCGLRSIVGRDPIKRVTNNYWLARMAGFQSFKDFDRLEYSEDHKELCQRIKHQTNTPYKFRKLKQQLSEKFHVKFQQGDKKQATRGFLVSFVLTDEKFNTAIISYKDSKTSKKSPF